MILDLKANNNKFERTETLKMYYDDIRRYETLSIDEEKKLFHLFRHGSKRERDIAREQIANANLRLVVSAAKKYGTDKNILDLINEGNIGLLEAIDTFDYEKAINMDKYKKQGCEYIKFATYAIWYIRRAIVTYLQKNSTLIRKSNIMKTYHAASKAISKFAQKEEREPTTEELFDILNEEYGINIQDVKDVMPTTFSSIDEPIDDEDAGNIGEINAFNSVSASINSYEIETENEYNKLLLSSLLEDLSMRDKKIIQMTFGIGYYREFTNEEIANEVGLTTERVRQIRDNAIAKMHNEAKKRFASLS